MRLACHVAATDPIRQRGLLATATSLARWPGAELATFRRIDAMQPDAHPPNLEAVPIGDAGHAGNCVRRDRQRPKEQAEDQKRSQQQGIRIEFWENGAERHLLFLTPARFGRVVRTSMHDGR